MDKFFCQFFFAPLVYVQNDQRVMGIILRYVCWGTHGPPSRRPGDPGGIYTLHLHSGGGGGRYGIPWFIPFFFFAFCRTMCCRCLVTCCHGHGYWE